MNIKTIIVLFLLGFLVSCSSIPMSEKEKERLEKERLYLIDLSYRR